MGTIEQLEERLRPLKLALIEAFGLDPEQTASSVSVTTEAVGFKCFGPVQDIETRLLAEAKLSGVLSGEHPRPITVEITADRWNEKQRQAVYAYLGEFPAPGFTLNGDVEAMRQALAATGGKHQLMTLPTGAGLELHPIVPQEPRP